MPSEGLKRVIGRLRAAVQPPDSDGGLLARFAAGRDEDAFASLLGRHGGMVWAVCRRVLGHAQDAEDAFQGTFLALAQRASSLAHCESVGGWLFRVATRTAAHAKAANARRRSRERSVGELPEVAVASSEPQDWHAVLQQEIGGLPEVYRQALVLCELEGVSRREGARLLGVPEGTLSSRLAAARRLLGERLVRRGLALSAGCLALAVPETLAAATLQAVTGPWGRTPAAPLAKGVLNAMFVSKFKGLLAVSALVVLVGAGVLTCGAGGRGPAPVASAAPAHGEDPPPEVKAPPADAEKALRRAREEAEALRQENERLLQELRKAKDDQAVLLNRLEEFKARQGAEAERERRLRDALRALDMALVQLEAAKARAEELAAELQAERKARREARLRVGDPAAEAEAALKGFQAAKDREAKQRALEALEKALQKLKDGLK
jgi:RNA polymerase sigma factor (sigma-70 family)